MTKLSDLNPRVHPDSFPRTWHELILLCPKCRKHEISVNTWAGKPCELEVGKLEDGTPNIKRMWHREGEGIGDLTLTPSINREGLGDKCGGWHGFITNGEATP